MRAISFRYKALIICVLFLAPITLLSYGYFTRMAEDMSFSEKERVGVEYNRAIFPLIDLAQQLRRDAIVMAESGSAPPSMAKVSDGLEDGYAKLALMDKRLGESLATASAYAAVQAAYQSARTATAGDAVFPPIRPT